jgi:hypothetical protein
VAQHRGPDERILRRKSFYVFRVGRGPVEASFFNAEYVRGRELVLIYSTAIQFSEKIINFLC